MAAMFAGERLRAVEVFSLSYVLPEMIHQMTESVHISPTEWLKALQFSLLFSVEAKILRYFICTSGNGGHL